MSSPNNVFVHLVRYEDLLFYPKEAMHDLATFILEETNIKGKQVEANITRLLNQGDSN